MRQLNSIAVVQTAFIGDILLTLPMVRALRAELPNVEIVLVTTPVGADITRGVPFVDRTVAFDKRGAHRSTAGMRDLVSAVGHVDAAIVPHKSMRTMRLVRLLNAPVTITYNDAWARYGATVQVPYPRPLHDADRHLQLLRAVLPGAAWTKEQLVPMTITTEEDRSAAMSMVGDLGRFVVLAPGTAWPTKQWPLPRMQDLASMIVDAGLAVVVIGDAAVQGRITGNNILDAAGRTTLGQAAAIIGLSAAIVGNDSAPLHFASLQNVPTVAVFGPTVMEFGFGPFSSCHAVVALELPCRPCSPHGTRVCPLGTHACMQDIPAESVMKALEAVLAQAATSSYS